MPRLHNGQVVNGTVLIVEDDRNLADMMLEYLQQEGFSSTWLWNGNLVVPWVRDHKPSIILLHLILPYKSGLDICEEIRSFSTVPIIMVTARTDESDRLLGLELGADDYICKPFSPREVVARVKTILRRTTPTDSPYVVDESQYKVTISGQQFPLAL